MKGTLRCVWCALRERGQTSLRRTLTLPRVALTPAGQALWARTGCLDDEMGRSSGMKPAQIAALSVQVRAFRDALVSGVAVPGSP